MKVLLKPALIAAFYALAMPSSVTATSRENWVVIAAGTNGGIGYSQGGNQAAVKSRVLARCKANNGNNGGNNEKCGSAWGKTETFLIVIQCPISATEDYTWGWYSDTSLTEAREGALSRMKNRTNSHGYLTRAQDCVDRISYSNGEILVH